MFPDFLSVSYDYGGAISSLVYSKYKPFNKDLLKISGMAKLEQNNQK